VWPFLLVARFGAGAMLPLIVAPLAWKTVEDLRARRGAELNASLADTARLQLVYGLLLAFGIAVGA